MDNFVAVDTQLVTQLFVVLIQGLMMWWHCRQEKDEMVACMEKWFYDKTFKEAVIEEYLNERSHFRQTGVKTKRYEKGTMVLRDEKSDPALDKDGNYRPRKPNGWDEAYAKTGPPKWANFKYD